MIKLNMLGIADRTYTWIKTFYLIDLYKSVLGMPYKENRWWIMVLLREVSFVQYTFLS